MVWGFLYGADIALFMFLATWLLRSLLVAWPAGAIRRPWSRPPCCSRSTRPEGLPLAVLVAAGWRARSGAARTRRARRVLPWVAGRGRPAASS